MVFLDKKEKTCLLIDMVTPVDSNINTKEAEKLSHYKRLHSTLAAEQSALNQYTVQTFRESEDTRCCVNIIFATEDGHVNARNMSRIIV